MSRIHIVGGRDAPQHVFICTTSYGGGTSGIYGEALAATLPALEAAGIGATYCLIGENCHVDDARNSAVHQFLKTSCTDLLFIDADVGWRAAELIALLAYDRDLVGGVYPKRRPDDEEEWPVHFLKKKEIWSEPDGLIEVEGAPTGFLRIRRAVLEAMVAAEPRRYWGMGETRDDDPHHVIFERTYEDGMRWSGDYAFCRRWRKMDGKVFVAPEMTLSHEGKKVWIGCMGDGLRKKAGIPAPRFVEAIAKIKAGDLSPETFVDLSEGFGNVPWSAPEAMLLAAAKLVRSSGPVLECGSGLSTLVMAAKGAEVHALEHDLAWLRRMRGLVERFGLKATIHYAPLTEDGWYSIPDALPQRFALAVIDGPPRWVADRGLVFAKIGERIADAHWIIDDVNAETIAGRETTCYGDERSWAIALTSDRIKEAA